MVRVDSGILNGIPQVCLVPVPAICNELTFLGARWLSAFLITGRNSNYIWELVGSNPVQRSLKCSSPDGS
jgi:hypothetical protein